MKIAVCVSGGVRYPHLGLQSISKIIPNEGVKVFIHTWQINDREGFIKTLHGMEYKEFDRIVDDNISILLNEYNPTDIVFEDYEETKHKFEELYESLSFLPVPEGQFARTDVGPISMHYSIYRCNQLKIEYEEKNNIEFDWIIRMRTDSEFKYDLNLESLFHDLNIPSGENWREDGINDQFAIGRSKIMDLYSNLYNNFENCQDNQYYPESIFNSYLKKMELDICRIDFPVKINNGQDFRKVWYPELVEW